MRWPVPDLGKWLAIALASFVLILGIYEFLVRRWSVLRVLFGMKALPREAEVEVPQVRARAV